MISGGFGEAYFFELNYFDLHFSETTIAWIWSLFSYCCSFCGEVSRVKAASSTSSALLCVGSSMRWWSWEEGKRLMCLFFSSGSLFLPSYLLFFYCFVPQRHHLLPIILPKKQHLSKADTCGLIHLISFPCSCCWELSSSKSCFLT